MNNYSNNPLPTRIGLHLAMQAGLSEKIRMVGNGTDLEFPMIEPIANFQRMAMAGANMDSAIAVFEAYLAPRKSLDKKDCEVLKLIYKFSKEETSGIIIQQLMKITSSSMDDKAKVLASQLILEISKGNLNDNDVSKLVVNLTPRVSNSK